MPLHHHHHHHHIVAPSFVKRERRSKGDCRKRSWINMAVVGSDRGYHRHGGDDGDGDDPDDMHTTRDVYHPHHRRPCHHHHDGAQAIEKTQSSSSSSSLPHKNSWLSADLLQSSSCNHNNNNNNKSSSCIHTTAVAAETQIHAPLKKRWVRPISSAIDKDTTDIPPFTSMIHESAMVRSSSLSGASQEEDQISIASGACVSAQVPTESPRLTEGTHPPSHAVARNEAMEDPNNCNKAAVVSSMNSSSEDKEKAATTITTTQVPNEKVVVVVRSDPMEESIVPATLSHETTMDRIAREFQEARQCAAAGYSSNDNDDDETDDEAVMAWGRMMFGIAAPTRVIPEQAEPGAVVKEQTVRDDSSATDTSFRWEDFMPPVVSLAERVKMRRGHRPESPPMAKKSRRGWEKTSTCATRKKAPVQQQQQQDDSKLSTAEAKRRKEMAKPLTAADLREILADDKDCGTPCNDNWVRRSVRLPWRALLSSPNVRSLLEKLRGNDGDMKVLKMKKYVNDPDAPAVVIDAALDALEENTNCQALYIQNFNQGMRDKQVLHLLSILQLPTCNIWCLNIGETYNVSMKTWGVFTKGLKKTKVTHMYASEHTITSALKDEIRDTIRRNRSKHNMHLDPNNLDVIVQCTHCWWNPINAKVLRPFLRRKGYEHILNDREALGLKGSMSEAPGDEVPLS